MTAIFLISTIFSTFPVVSVGISGMVPLQTRNLLYGNALTLAVNVWSGPSWVTVRAESDLLSFQGASDYRVQMATLGPGVQFWTPLVSLDLFGTTAWLHRSRGEGKESGALLGYGFGLSWRILHWHKLDGRIGTRLWIFPGRLRDFRFISIDLSFTPRF